MVRSDTRARWAVDPGVDAVGIATVRPMGVGDRVFEVLPYLDRSAVHPTCRPWFPRAV
jgi:hypothetical protein